MRIRPYPGGQQEDAGDFEAVKQLGDDQPNGNTIPPPALSFQEEFQFGDEKRIKAEAGHACAGERGQATFATGIEALAGVGRGAVGSVFFRFLSKRREGLKRSKKRAASRTIPIATGEEKQSR